MACAFSSTLPVACKLLNQPVFELGSNGFRWPPSTRARTYTSYFSIMIGQHPMLFLWSNSWQVFGNIWKLQDPPAAFPIFIAIAASDTERCHWMLTRSHLLQSGSKFCCTFSVKCLQQLPRAIMQKSMECASPQPQHWCKFGVHIYVVMLSIQRDVQCCLQVSDTSQDCLDIMG